MRRPEALLLTPIAALCAITAAAAQESRRIPGETTAPFAAIVSAGELVQATREIEMCPDGSCGPKASDLRVRYVITDGGSPTDISPRYRLWLTMFNDIAEHSTISAQWMVAESYHITEPTRTAPGLYRFDYTTTDSSLQCYARVSLEVDARKASVSVRNGKGVDFFEDPTFVDPITVREVERRCSEN